MTYSIHWNTKNVPGVGCGPDQGDCPFPKTANLWRVGGDIGPNWNSVR